MPKKIDYASMFTLRADGRYMGYWHDASGARHAIYDRDAEKLYFRIQDKETDTPVSFGDIAREWESVHFETLKAGTLSSYKPILRAIIAEHGSLSIDDVTAKEIERVLLRENEQNYSAKHASTVKSVYRMIFDYAIVHGYATNNPAAAVKVPRGMSKEKRKAPENDVIDIVKANVSQPFGLFPYFLLYTGFRASEAAALQWGDIDFKEKTISCTRSADMHLSTPETKETKTEAGERSIPLFPSLSPYLEKPKDAKDDDLVFPGTNGKLMTRSALRSRWLTWCRAAGLAEPVTTERTHSKKKIKYKAIEWRPTLTAHQLRHGFATIAVESGVDELTLMEWMGHADVATTHRIYTNYRKSHATEQIEKMSAGLDKA